MFGRMFGLGVWFGRMFRYVCECLGMFRNVWENVLGECLVMFENV
jgi:hypothetical protein